MSGENVVVYQGQQLVGEHVLGQHSGHADLLRLLIFIVRLSLYYWALYVNMVIHVHGAGVLLGAAPHVHYHGVHRIHTLLFLFPIFATSKFVAYLLRHSHNVLFTLLHGEPALPLPALQQVQVGDGEHRVVVLREA